MSLVDTSFVIASRCPLEPSGVKRILLEVKYKEEIYGSKSEVTGTIIFLARKGLKAGQIIDIMKIAFDSLGTIAEIKYDPIFSDLPSVIRYEREQNRPSVIRYEREQNRPSVIRYEREQNRMAIQQTGKAKENWIPKYCMFKFRGPRCKYEGDEVFCGKEFSHCKAIGNEKNFGGINPNSSINSVTADSLRYMSDGGILGMESIDKLKRRLAEKGILPEDVREKIKKRYQEELQLNRPSEFPERDWNLLSAKSKKLILKRLGYNIKKGNENKNRAIDI